ncbi:MAG: hypothetical protein JW751_06210 [Polyangiaceae bacterium]|nr:hypothetical protein [Polyangiaceae bacterium]
MEHGGHEKGAKGPNRRFGGTPVAMAMVGMAMAWATPGLAQGAADPGTAEPTAATASFPEPPIEPAAGASNAAPETPPPTTGTPTEPAVVPPAAPPGAPPTAAGPAPAVRVVEPVAPAPGAVPAEFEPPAEPEPYYGRHLALGVGTATGLGIISAAVRLRLNYAALEPSLGLVPILAMSAGAPECTEIVVGVPPQAALSALFFFVSDQKKFVPGVRVAANYIWELGWGGMAGFEGELRINQPISLGFGAGLRVIPEGGRWAAEKLSEKVSSGCYLEDIEDDPTNMVFPYVNFQLLVYAL